MKLFALIAPLFLASVLLLTFHPVTASAEPPGESLVDRVLVIKNQKKLVLFRNGEVVKVYKVALGRKAGAKGCRGDLKTPEGHYLIDRRNSHSYYYKSLHISYPNEQDRVRARKNGRSAGGNVEIHGLPKGYEDLGSVQSRHNWTKGCIAVSNEEMDEIWRMVPDGTPIDIVP